MAAGLGAARTATFGGSDVLLRGIGGDEAAEFARTLERINPTASTIGEIGGMFVPGAAPARIGAAALKVGSKVAAGTGAKLAGSALGRVTQRAGLSGLTPIVQGTGKIAETATKLGTAGALESAAMGVQQSISDYALDRDQASVENTIAQVGLGAFLGGGAGFGLGAVGKATGLLGKAALDKIQNNPKMGVRPFLKKYYPEVLIYLRGLKGEEAEVVREVFANEKVANRIVNIIDNPKQTIDQIELGIKQTQEGAAKLANELGEQRAAIQSKLDDRTPKGRLKVSQLKVRNELDRIYESFQPRLEQIRLAPDFEGAEQAKLIDQFMDVLNDRMRGPKTSPASIARTTESLLTKNMKHIRSLKRAGRPTETLEEFDSAMRSMLRDDTLWGAPAREYADAQTMFRSFLDLRNKLFGFSGKGQKDGIFTKRDAAGRLILDRGKMENMLGRAASDKGDEAMETLKAFNASMQDVATFLQSKPSLTGVDVGNIAKLIDDSQNMVADIFSAKAHSVMFNRQQSFTGAVLKGPIGMAFGAGMLGLPGPIIGAAGVAGTLLNNPNLMMRYAHGMSMADTGLSARVFNSVKRFLGRSEVQERLTLAGTLGGAYSISRAASSLGEKRKRGESEIAFLSRAVKQYASDPLFAEQQVRQSMYGMEGVNPDAYYRMVNQTMKATQFLNSKLPPLSDDPFVATENMELPLSEEMRLQGYVEAIWKPGKILDELSEGNLRPETVETVREVYPEFYNEVRGAVLDKVTSQRNKLDYYQKLDLALLFGIPTVQGLGSMEAVQSALQASDAEARQQQQREPSRRSTSQTAQISMSGSTGLQARRAT